jgi:hypothetical protein
MPPPSPLAEMREQGVRSILIYCRIASSRAQPVRRTVCGVHSEDLKAATLGQSESPQNNVRLKTKFVSEFKADSAVQSRSEKYFASVFQKSMVGSRRPASTRGAFRERHEREAGCDGRGRRHKTCGADADGEVVWFWHPWAGVKFVEVISTSDGDNKAWSPGRARYKP